MPKSAFTEIFRSTFRDARYLCATSIHAIRWQLGKKVDELYTEVQRSQHLTQADSRIFGQSVIKFAAWAASLLHLMLHKAYCVLYYPLAKIQILRLECTFDRREYLTLDKGNRPLIRASAIKHAQAFLQLFTQVWDAPFLNVFPLDVSGYLSTSSGHDPPRRPAQLPS
jgi:hypothetical protein